MACALVFDLASAGSSMPLAQALPWCSCAIRRRAGWLVRRVSLDDTEEFCLSGDLNCLGTLANHIRPPARDDVGLLQGSLTRPGNHDSTRRKGGGQPGSSTGRSFGWTLASRSESRVGANDHLIDNHPIFTHPKMQRVLPD